MGGSGAYAFWGENETNSLIEEGARSMDERFLESTPSGRGLKEFIH